MSISESNVTLSAGVARSSDADASAWTRFTTSCSSLWASVTGWFTPAPVEHVVAAADADTTPADESSDSTPGVLHQAWDTTVEFCSNTWSRIRPSSSGESDAISVDSDESQSFLSSTWESISSFFSDLWERVPSFGSQRPVHYAAFSISHEPVEMGERTTATATATATSTSHPSYVSRSVGQSYGEDNPSWAEQSSSTDLRRRSHRVNTTLNREAGLVVPATEEEDTSLSFWSHPIDYLRRVRLTTSPAHGASTTTFSADEPTRRATGMRATYISSPGEDSEL